MKRIISVILAVAVCAAVFTSCAGRKGNLEGAHVFMFKCTGNAYGEIMFAGFKKAVTEAGGKAVFKAPAEPTVAAQVEMLDTLIIQKVASITISTCSDTGYDEVFRRAREAGITIVSADSAAAPDYRVVHVDACEPAAVGSALVQSATLIALGKDYPAGEDMEKATQSALAGYNGKEIKYGVISSSVDTPVQNEWIAKMERELKKDMYKGKISPDLDVKYGNDDPNMSTTQANAFVAENRVDMIVSPTTIGMAAGGEALKKTGSRIKLTGLGLPSEMQGYMPAGADKNAFDYVCPYMMLWNVEDFGAAAGTAAMAAVSGKYDGKVGSTFEFRGKTVVTKKSDDGGTCVYPLDPFIFDKNNISEWKDKL